MNAVYLWTRELLLRFLRVPPEPDPPAGAPGTLRIFRAGRNFYRLRFWLWFAKQLGAVAGFVFVFFLIHSGTTSGLEKWRESAARRGKAKEIRWSEQVTRYAWAITGLETFAFAIALLQLPFTYALIRLDYEQRWYLVTDRSLRIREGVANVREMTLSFANIQQTTLRQGPLQRLLGIADLVVTTAGGGGVVPGAHGGGTATPWHTGVLRAVENAEEIRDLIQTRIRQLKSAGTGVGDADEAGTASIQPHSAHTESSSLPHSSAPSASIAAARELLVEVQTFRRSLVSKA